MLWKGAGVGYKGGGGCGHPTTSWNIHRCGMESDESHPNNTLQHPLDEDGSNCEPQPSDTPVDDSAGWLMSMGAPTTFVLKFGRPWTHATELRCRSVCSCRPVHSWKTQWAKESCNSFLPTSIRVKSDNCNNDLEAYKRGTAAGCKSYPKSMVVGNLGSWFYRNCEQSASGINREKIRIMVRIFVEAMSNLQTVSQVTPSLTKSTIRFTFIFSMTSDCSKKRFSRLPQGRGYCLDINAPICGSVSIV